MAINAFTYHTVSQRGEAEWKDRGSRFIGIAVPVESTQAIKQALEQIREQYPRATHYCYAWRVGFTAHEFRANDDGEPSGSAGKPILGQLDSHGLTNVLLVVVRYYGGSKLGVPGLINAYKTAATEALQLAHIEERDRCHLLLLEFDYTIMNDVMRCLKPYHVRINTQEQGLFCTLNIGIPLRVLDTVMQRLNELRNVSIKSLNNN
jgi:uncharacterized YigZ family protein